MSSLTASVHLRLTQRFIDENPVTVTVYRSTLVADGRGGWTPGAPAPVTTVIGRLVGESAALRNSRATPDGVQTRPMFHFITMPDEDLQIDDTFTIDSDTYEVRNVSTTPPWRMDLEVERQS